jgi:hypothetical protein
VSEPTHNKTPEKIVEMIKNTDFRNIKIRILDSVDIRKK